MTQKLDLQPLTSALFSADTTTTPLTFLKTHQGRNVESPTSTKCSITITANQPRGGKYHTGIPNRNTKFVYQTKPESRNWNTRLKYQLLYPTHNFRFEKKGKIAEGQDTVKNIGQRWEILGSEGKYCTVRGNIGLRGEIWDRVENIGQ